MSAPARGLTETSDGRLRSFVSLVARRHGTAATFIRSAGPPSAWTSASVNPDTAEVDETGDGVPEGVGDTVIHLSMEDVRILTSADGLRRALESSPTALLSVRADGESAALTGIPTLEATLRELGLAPDLTGVCAPSPTDAQCIAILARGSGPPFRRPPDDFRVVALVTAFNEEDVIADVIQHLTEEGVEVILTDNWSTDSTVERAQSFLGKGLLRIARFPPDHPSSSFDLTELLSHEAALAEAEEASWFIHHDADEIRRSPWPGCTLREALYEVDRRGFNAVDHTQLDFHPTDDFFQPGERLEAYFPYFTPAAFIAHDRRINAWKNLKVPVDLLSSGGHNVQFDGRRVFPYNFLLKHYPVRSQAHGERKILRERKARWNANERRLGWHFQYDHIRKGHKFVRNPAELDCFDESFYETKLLERLSSVGLHQVPARYSSRARRVALIVLRRSRLLDPVLRVQRRVRAVRRRDVSLGKR